MFNDFNKIYSKGDFKMYLYHGSSKKFSQFELGHTAGNYVLAEGEGVYLVDNSSIKVALGYGCYIYKVRVADTNVFDFTKKVPIYNLFKYTVGDISIPQIKYIKDSFTDGVLSGDLRISDGYDEIYNLFDCYESTYARYGNKMDKLEAYFKSRYLEYINKRQAFKYNDKSLGVVYFTNHDLDKLHIVSVKSSSEVRKLLSRASAHSVRR